MRLQIQRIYQISKLEEFVAWKKEHTVIIFIIFILGFLVIRTFIGLHAYFIIFYLLLLLVLRFSFIEISLLYFLIALEADIVGNVVEANNYMSYVYIFLVLCIVKEYWLLFMRKNE
jgi:hypothetical protein